MRGCGRTTCSVAKEVDLCPVCNPKKPRYTPMELLRASVPKRKRG